MVEHFRIEKSIHEPSRTFDRSNGDHSQVALAASGLGQIEALDGPITQVFSVGDFGPSPSSRFGITLRGQEMPAAFVWPRIYVISRLHFRMVHFPDEKTLIKPENIRIYKQPNGVYTTQPKGKYISGLSECDGLTSVTVSIFPSWPEAKKEIESILQFALPASLPVYIPPQPPELSTKEFVPDLNRITVTVEDLTYLGLYVCTVSIIGFDSPDGGRDKICYEDFLPKMASPLHHQILSTLDDFCGHLREPNQVHDFSDSFGRFYTRFSWNGNGVEVGLANIRIYDEERRGHGFLTELIDHLKLDVRVKKIRVECVGSDKLKAYLRTNRFKEFSPNSNNFVLGGDEFEGLRR